ncbi:hypothetical protein Bbelb_213350 [Branchiostoma belcheri]|nr:hypothetical protein Bbelb_213350 [Branchiostoma belcheri]
MSSLRESWLIGVILTTKLRSKRRSIEPNRLFVLASIPWVPDCFQGLHRPAPRLKGQHASKDPHPPHPLESLINQLIGTDGSRPSRLQGKTASGFECEDRDFLTAEKWHRADKSDTRVDGKWRTLVDCSWISPDHRETYQPVVIQAQQNPTYPVPRSSDRHLSLSSSSNGWSRGMEGGDRREESVVLPVTSLSQNPGWMIGDSSEETNHINKSIYTCLLPTGDSARRGTHKARLSTPPLSGGSDQLNRTGPPVHNIVCNPYKYSAHRRYLKSTENLAGILALDRKMQDQLLCPDFRPGELVFINTGAHLALKI